MHVVVVGAGRVGLALADALGAAPPIGRREPIPAADVILVAVPPAGLPDVAGRLPRGVPALHTSGALSAEALAPHQPRGVFHPLMTFPGPAFGAVDLRGAAVRIAGDPPAVAAAERVATALGARAVTRPLDPVLCHASAVIAGNFATVLLAEAARVLVAAGADPEEASALLAPLALASIRNAAAAPAAALTGPAARGEGETVRAHRDALAGAGLEAQARLYDLLSERAYHLASARKRPAGDRT